MNLTIALSLILAPVFSYAVEETPFTKARSLLAEEVTYLDTLDHNSDKWRAAINIASLYKENAWEIEMASRLLSAIRKLPENQRGDTAGIWAEMALNFKKKNTDLSKLVLAVKMLSTTPYDIDLNTRIISSLSEIGSTITSASPAPSSAPHDKP